jgi:hypothetical protein
MLRWERTTVAEAEQPLDARLFQAPAHRHDESNIVDADVTQPSDQR